MTRINTNKKSNSCNRFFSILILSLAILLLSMVQFSWGCTLFNAKIWAGQSYSEAYNKTNVPDKFLYLEPNPYAMVYFYVEWSNPSPSGNNLRITYNFNDGSNPVVYNDVAYNANYHDQASHVYSTYYSDGGYFPVSVTIERINTTFNTEAECHIYQLGVYGVGSGTSEDPYQISTAPELLYMATHTSYYDKYCILTADINLADVPFYSAVIAPDMDSATQYFQGTAFTGTFDGDGHKISNLTISGDDDYFGLFGKIGSSGVVKNLGVENVSITSGDDSVYVGSLVAYNAYGSITSCYGTGSVASSNGTSSAHSAYIGGLAGANNGDISKCYAVASVTGGDYVEYLGGLIGYNGVGSGIEITNCYGRGNVSGGNNSEYLGGLIGCNASTDIEITNCYSTGTVTGTGADDLGGLIGSHNSQGTITGCFWDKEMSGIIGDGIGNIDPDPAGVSGKTTGEMQAEITFTNASWNFTNIWEMPGVDAYPVIIPQEGIIRYGGGLGTQESPYQINTTQQLLNLGNCPGDYSKYFILAANIDLSSEIFTEAVIAPDTDSSTLYHQGTKFTGSFDGNGHKIANLNVNTGSSGDDYLGLFGQVNAGGVIKNLTVENCSVTSGTGATKLGALVGQLVGSVENCCAINPTITGAGSSQLIGSLVGYIHTGGAVSNCYTIDTTAATATVTGGDGALYLGGLVGASNGSIDNSYAMASVAGGDGASDIGGLCGLNATAGPGSIVNSYSAGNVSAGTNSSNLGGLLGYNDGSTNTPIVENCYSTGTVTGTSNVGGLIGDNDSGTVDDSFWDKDTSGLITSDGGEGKTTLQMQDIDTFTTNGVDWDFTNTWRINDGQDYPFFKWQCYHVDSNGGSDSNNGLSRATAFATIQYAINNIVEDGDEIIVWPGTYSSIDFNGKAVTIRGTDPSNPSVVDSTIIDGNSGNVVVFDSGEDSDSVIEGVTITGGSNGVYCYHCESPQIRNCNITGNSSRAIIAAGTTTTDPSPIISGCKIYSNSSDSAIYFYNSDGGGLISDCEIYNNYYGIYLNAGSNVAISGCNVYGHPQEGIKLKGSQATISDCKVSNNKYGIYLSDSSISNISDCDINNNVGYYGVYLSSSQATVNGCNIYDNTYGVNSASGTLDIRNCVIARNKLSTSGKGIYFSDDNGSTVINCTIADNNNYGIQGVCSAIKNCIIWNNNDDIYGCESVVTYSCIEDVDDNGQGVIHTDPIFVNTDPASPDDYYHLWYSSECIDAGDPADVYSLEPDGGGGRINMGAYGNTSDARLRVDDDTDGMDDNWEISIWGSTSHAANDDEENSGAGDGLRNIDEYYIMWDPTEDNSGDIPASPVINGTRDLRFPTLHWAVMLAHDGESLTIPADTYNENISFDGRNIHITGAGPDATFINGNGSNDVIVFDHDEDNTAIIEGVTIQGGVNGVYYGKCGSPQILNCRITGNSSQGILIDENIQTGSTPIVISGCRIDNNSYGIYLYGDDASALISIWNCEIDNNNYYGVYLQNNLQETTISGCHIHDNSSSGICIHSSSQAAISNCEINNNHSSGVYLWYIDTQATVSDCNIYSNTNDGIYSGNCVDVSIKTCSIHDNGDDGIEAYNCPSLDISNDCVITGNDLRGIFLRSTIFDSPSATNASILNCEINNNNDDDDESSYGGIYLSRAHATVSGCNIHNNKVSGVRVHGEPGNPSALDIHNCIIASNPSRGIYFVGANISTVINCTIVGNANCGIEGGCNAIKNCIIWNNNDDLDGCELAVNYSCIEDMDSGPGVINIDPVFVDPDNGNYHLWYSSECINAGDPADNSSEPDGSRVDMGAYGNTSDARLFADNDNGDGTGDGINDYWELLYWPSDPITSHGPNDDTEGSTGDGLRNIDEYHIMWNPTVDNSAEINNPLVLNSDTSLYFPTFGWAMRLAHEGDVLTVSAGTYNETIHFSGKDVHIIGAGSSQTIINGNGGDVILFDSNNGKSDEAIIEGVTITGGVNGVYYSNCGSPQILNCHITDNSSRGIRIYGPSSEVVPSPIISGCDIYQNSEVSGGAEIYINGVNASASISNCNIYGSNHNAIHFDQASGTVTISGGEIHGNNGSGVYIDSGNVIISISDCAIYDNISYGIYLHDSETHISNCNIYDNDSYGIFSTSSETTVSGCNIYGNKYAGVYSGYGTLDISHCVVAENNTANSAITAGIYFSNDDGFSTVVNCTIVGNEYHGIDGTCAAVTNCIVWGNDDDIDDCGSVLSYSCIQDTGDGGMGVIHTDPSFDTSTNYKLLSNSLCIDAGAPWCDYSSEPSPNGNRVNMGAYGNTSDATTTTDVDSDGMSDYWELSVWGNLNESDTGNPDNDDFVNYVEYLFGYDPKTLTTANTLLKAEAWQGQFDPTVFEQVTVGAVINRDSSIVITVINTDTQVEVYNETKSIVAGVIAELWDGKDDNKILEPGNYEISIQVAGDTCPGPTCFTGNVELNYPHKISGVKCWPYRIIPTNGEITNISYSTSVEADIVVEIIDPLENVIRTIEDNGSHNVIWDGKNNFGKYIAVDGQYIVRVRYSGMRENSEYTMSVYR